MNDESAILKKIIRDFALKLAEHYFFGKEYLIYIFSMETNKKHTNYSLKFEGYDATRALKHSIESNGFPILPIPPNQDTRLAISPKSYHKYRYGRGGNIAPFSSILHDHKDNHAHQFLTREQFDYWKDKHVYYCGYGFKNKPLAIFLIFDFDQDEEAENQLHSLFLEPILKRVEDTYHKRYIFNEKYLNVLLEKIGDMFPPISFNVNELRQDTRHTHYLQKIYYNFLINNFDVYQKQLKPLHQEKLLTLTKEFEKHQRNLFRIPNYRDHFLHQYNVYILGVAVISTISREFKRNIMADFNKAYRPYKKQGYKDKNDESVIWFLASMFHDIANPIEKCGKWLDAFFQQYIYHKKYDRPLLTANINISNVISDIDYNNCIEELAEYHYKLNFENSDIDYKKIASESIVNKRCGIRTQILDQTIRYRDHGILSAIMLLHIFKNDKKIFKFLFPAAAAISIHNYLWTEQDILENPCEKCIKIQCQKCKKWKKSYDQYFKKWKEKNKDKPYREKVHRFRHISYENDPVAFLLILCDLLHDWGRHNLEHLEQAFDPFYNPCQLKGLEVKDKNMIFDIEITPPRSPQEAKKIDKLLLHKKRYIVKIFSRLQFIDDQDIIIRLNLEGTPTLEFKMSFFQ